MSQLEGQKGNINNNKTNSLPYRRLSVLEPRMLFLSSILKPKKRRMIHPLDGTVMEPNAPRYKT